MTVALFDVCEHREESWPLEGMGIMEHVRSSELPSERVAADLRRRVRSGEWAPGSQIPSVAQLAEHYSTSRTTVQKSVRILVAEEILVTRHGWGTFVAGGPEGDR
jgi:DNA-binding GntR family transcriptional regulator